MAPGSSKRWNDDQSIIRSWPLNYEWTEDDGQQMRQAKHLVSGKLVNWEVGKPETAVHLLANDNLEDERLGIPRAHRIAEAHERYS
jgi:hypothetical protein